MIMCFHIPTLVPTTFSHNALSRAVIIIEVIKNSKAFYILRASLKWLKSMLELLVMRLAKIPNSEMSWDPTFIKYFPFFDMWVFFIYILVYTLPSWSPATWLKLIIREVSTDWKREGLTSLKESQSHKLKWHKIEENGLNLFMRMWYSQSTWGMFNFKKIF